MDTDREEPEYYLPIDIETTRLYAMSGGGCLIGGFFPKAPAQSAAERAEDNKQMKTILEQFGREHPEFGSEE